MHSDPADLRPSARRALAWSGALLLLGLIAALAAGPLGWPARPDGGIDWAVLLQLRAPRAVAAVLVGAALAGSGAALQAVFRNPLAAPDILGVSSGAALGAGLAIWGGASGWLVQVCAFGGALCAVAGVALFARLMRSAEPTPALILCGIAIAALFSSALALLTSLADPTRQLPAITYWLLGGLAGTAPAELLPAGVLMAAGLGLLWLLRWRIDALLLPDDEALALGHDPRRLRALAIGAAALAASAAVAAAGLIGWVGLLLPHAARLIAGAAFARMFPLACLGGASFLLLIDTGARWWAPVDIPPGVGTALVGVPLLLWLLARRGAGVLPR
ncbi:MAG: FecCD family ABC transporter permease [Burkholderiaceae bacterium]